MQTLSNGVKKPEDGDAGNVWSDGLETNAELLNDVISDLNNIDITAISRPTQSLDSANWNVEINGKGYSQIIAMPGTLALNSVGMTFRVTSGPKTNRLINPTIEPISLTSFYVIVNDSTLNIEILYV